jgi:putative membrane protein
MYFYYYGFHLLFAILWIAFFLILHKTFEHDLKEKKIYLFLSTLFIFIILFLGSKMLILNPAFTKNSNWLHVKLSIFILLILENFYFVYLYFKKKVVSLYLMKFLYFLNLILITSMLILSIFKPF